MTATEHKEPETPPINQFEYHDAMLVYRGCPYVGLAKIAASSKERNNLGRAIVAALELAGLVAAGNTDHEELQRLAGLVVYALNGRGL